jgi:hypothetical protein
MTTLLINKVKVKITDNDFFSSLHDNIYLPRILSFEPYKTFFLQKASISKLKIETAERTTPPALPYSMSFEELLTEMQEFHPLEDEDPQISSYAGVKLHPYFYTILAVFSSIKNYRVFEAYYTYLLTNNAVYKFLAQY